MIVRVCKILSIICCLSVASYVSTVQNQEIVKTLQQKQKKKQQLTATEALYLKYALYNADAWSQSCNWKRLLTRVADVEKSMDTKGYVTFVHARRWEWNFLNDVWNLICAIRAKQSTMSDKICLRQRDEESCDVKDLYTMRKQLLKDGVWSPTGVGKTGKEAELTFMNRTLFSTYSGWSDGECSGQYFLENANCFGSDQALGVVIELLNKYGLLAYEKEFEQLYYYHKTLSKYGEALCISIKKNAVNELVYPVLPNGNKDMSCPNVLQRVMNTEKKVVKDKQYFDSEAYDTWQLYCFAVTDIPGEYGKKYTINAVHLADPAKYKQYKNKLQQLFEKIKKDCGI